ncbi:MAG: glycosylhydrolase-like jelly roll fold domain-containing protein, partial [Planctomycetota bacterium]
QGFNFVGPKHTDRSPGFGYDYDVANAEVILTRMSVKDGRVTLPDGMSYELLVLPEREDVDLDVLKKIEQMVKDGATVVGPKPTRSNGLGDHAQRDAEVRKIAARLWGPCDGTTTKEHAYGKGKIIWGKHLKDILKERGIGRDFEVDSPSMWLRRGAGESGKDDPPPIDYLHRRLPEADLYFVSNRTSDSQVLLDCSFRVTGRVPQVWMPDTGRLYDCRHGRRGDDQTSVKLHLPPHGSAFVVFRDKEDLAEPEGRYVTTPEERGAIEGPWEVRFPTGWGAPASKTFEELVSWTEAEEVGVRYFSGVATYENTFTVSEDLLKASRELMIDLGKVRFVAEVYVNGESQGIVWKPPYRVDVKDALRVGENRLVVEVANTWSNRLVGDARDPDGKQFCRTNMDKSLTWEAPWKDTPLLESGLLGPVRLISTGIGVIPREEMGMPGKVRVQ